MKWIAAASFGLVLMVVCSAVAEKYVTIIRRNSAPEQFSYPRSKDKDEFPSSCTSFNGSSISSSGSTEDCTCKNTKETFAYSENKWSCVGPNLYAARNISGSASCRLRYGNGEWISTVSNYNAVRWTKIDNLDGQCDIDCGSASCRLRYGSGEWIPTVNERQTWKKIDNLSKEDGRCNIDWSASSALNCSNVVEPILIKPTYQFYLNLRQYGFYFRVFPKEMEGRIIKIVIHCKRDAHPATNHCLMLKVEGQIKCPFMHHMKSTTTPNIVTSSFLSSTAKTKTNVTVRPTTKVEAKNKKPAKGSRSGVPVPAVVGGVAAVLISEILVVIIVFLACRQKRMRKNEKFGNQDPNGQLHQYENEPPENGFVHQTTLQPSFVVQTEEATPDYVNMPCQTKKLEMSSKENSAAAGLNPSCRPNPEYESVRDYENIEHPYQALQNRPWNSENCDYAKLVFKKRNQTLSPMQDN